MKKALFGITAAAIVAISLGLIGTAAGAEPKLKPITIAQFGHVFLYMPLYVALDAGFFKEQGLEVKLVSTGGDEKTFTAVSTGNAQFWRIGPNFCRHCPRARPGRQSGGLCCQRHALLGYNLPQ